MYHMIVTEAQQNQRKLITEGVEATAAGTDSWSWEAYSSGSMYEPSLLYLSSSRPTSLHSKISSQKH